MVVKMMRWRPWPPLQSKKFEVKLVVRRFEGYNPVEGLQGMTVEIRWKGSKFGLSPFRRTVKRNFTKEGRIGENGVVFWEEEFKCACCISGYKDNAFHPWEISLTILNRLNLGQKNKVLIVGTTSLNLAEFVSKAEENVIDLNIPVISSSSTDHCGSLLLSLSLLEMRNIQDSVDLIQRSIVLSPPHMGEVQSSSSSSSSEKEELSALKSSLRKVKMFTDYVSIKRTKKGCNGEDGGSEGKSSVRSEDGDCTYRFDSESSSDESEKGDSDEGKVNPTVRKSFSYGSLASTRIKGNDEDWVYYSHRKEADVGCCSSMEDSIVSVSETSLLQSSKHSILPWRKRKMNFRTLKTKGEPLLKKAYGEEGGDDIDFDRRQDESLSFGWYKTDEESTVNQSPISEFGDDNFAIGSWSQMEITSRDGNMKLQTEVFFASIDQRSEKAAGESACTALVAVIADWFQKNRDLMPIKSQFDSLIREGSLEWRNLCNNEIYIKKFPDKHLDLETVLQAKVRPLSVNSQKSFVGFFHPDIGMDEIEGRFDFLQSAMSFDNIWDEISNEYPQVHIISWNDHFFILKIEEEAYYIIDTLGERLYEGCREAYILKFDRSSKIYQHESLEEKPVEDLQEQSDVVGVDKDSTEIMEEEKVVACEGKESCKEYIKMFLAAIPIRELQAEIKKGLITSSTPLHHRLQIEFHFTQIQQTEQNREAVTL